MRRSALFEDLNREQLVNRPVLQSHSSSSSDSCCQHVDLEEKMMNFDEESGVETVEDPKGVAAAPAKSVDNFLHDDAAMAGTIPRAHIGDQDNKRLRPQFPLPGTIERTRGESASHYYASAATLQRERPATLQRTPNGPRIRPIYDECQRECCSSCSSSIIVWKLLGQAGDGGSDGHL